MKHIIDKLFFIDIICDVEESRWEEFSVVLDQEIDKLDPHIHEFLSLLKDATEDVRDRMFTVAPEFILNKFEKLLENVKKTWNKKYKNKKMPQEKIDEYKEKCETKRKKISGGNLIEQIFELPGKLDLGDEEFLMFTTLAADIARKLDPRIFRLLSTMVFTNVHMRKRLSEKMPETMKENCKKFIEEVEKRWHSDLRMATEEEIKDEKKINIEWAE